MIFSINQRLLLNCGCWEVENVLPNLKILRQEHGIRQQRLADAIGVSQQSINQYENHSVEPDISILTRLADHFNTSIDFIVGRTNIRRPSEHTEAFHPSQAIRTSKWPLIATRTREKQTSLRQEDLSERFSGRCDTICDKAEPRKNQMASGKIKVRTSVIVIGFVIIGLMIWKRSNKHITKIPPRSSSRTGREAGKNPAIQSKKKNRWRASRRWRFFFLLGIVRKFPASRPVCDGPRGGIFVMILKSIFG